MRTSFGWEDKGRYGSFRSRMNAGRAGTTVRSFENICHTWEVCSRRGAIQIHICLTLCLPSACGVSVSTPQRNSQAEWTWEAGFLLDIITFNWYRYRSWNSLVQHHFSSVWEHFLHWTQSMYTYWIVAYWENFLASLSRCSMARCTSHNIQAKIAT